VTWNILGYSLLCERREKWRVVLRKFHWEEEIVAINEAAFFCPSDLVNTKTYIPLRVGEEWWIYTSTLRVLVYIYHYSPPPSGDSCKLILHLENLLLSFFSSNLEGKFFCPAENRWTSTGKEEGEEDQQIQPNRKNIRPSVRSVEPRPSQLGARIFLTELSMLLPLGSNIGAQ